MVEDNFRIYFRGVRFQIFHGRNETNSAAASRLQASVNTRYRHTRYRHNVKYLPYPFFLVSFQSPRMIICIFFIDADTCRDIPKMKSGFHSAIFFYCSPIKLSLHTHVCMLRENKFRKEKQSFLTPADIWNSPPEIAGIGGC